MATDTILHEQRPAVWFPTVRTGTGTDVFTNQLAEGLVRRGFQAEIAWLPHMAEYLPWFVRPPKPPKWANLIHINTFLHPRFFRWANMPVLATNNGCVHDPALTPYKSVAQRVYHRLWVYPIEARALQLIDSVNAVSDYTAHHFSAAFNLGPIPVIPNWVPDDAFVPRTSVQPSEPFRLLFIGKWSRRKGSDLLPEIMSRLGERFELRYTGTPPKSIRTTENMIPLGWNTDRGAVRQWMMEADAMLFPSRMEGLSFAAIEALAAGLPVIASETSSLPELITHGWNGMLCPVDDAGAFAAAARQLAADHEAWRIMCLNANASAKSRYSESIAVDAYLDLYREALRARQGIDLARELHGR